MERRAERYQFRMTLRGVNFETWGRILFEPDGELTLQVWLLSAESSPILLEVAEGKDQDDLWRRLHILCQVRGLVVSELRKERGERGGWEPIPHGPTPPPDPKTWKRQNLDESADVPAPSDR
jgi:hypothetical protein